MTNETNADAYSFEGDSYSMPAGARARRYRVEPAPAPAWQERMAAALLDPTSDERLYIDLIETIGRLAKKYGTDYVLREGVAKMIVGAQVMLEVAPERLDRGSLDLLLHKAAKMIDYDPACEQFEDEKVTATAVVEIHTVECGPAGCVCKKESK